MGTWLRFALSIFALALAQSAAADEPGTVRLRWLGVAGFAIAASDTVLLHDPYLSRPGIWRTLFSRYEPDPSVLEPLIAAGSPVPELRDATLILVGHSHFDHLGDVAYLSGPSGAAVVGSETTANIALAYGVNPERIRRLDPGETLEQGAFEVRVVASQHARVMFGRVPLVGEVTEPPEAPIHAVSFPLGDARAYLVTHRPTGIRIFHLSSAGVDEQALDALRSEGITVDVVLAAVMGRDDQFASAIVDGLSPRIVIPHHFDDFFEPLASEDAVAPLDADDLDDFGAEIQAAADAAGLTIEVRRMDLFEAIEIAPATAR